jgi:ribosomal protein L11 methyltransferase
MSSNPFHQPSQLWQRDLLSGREQAALYDETLADLAYAIATFEVEGAQDVWRTTLYVASPAARQEADTRIALLDGLSGQAVQAAPWQEVAPRDWIKEMEYSFPPFSVGPFYIHGSHVTIAPPSGSTPLLVDANTAFGTGEHATTQGCLLAMEAICRRRIPAQALDMGCGSAILAMALGKRWHVPVLAVEIDAESVRVAQENAVLNRVQREVRVVLGDGYAAPEVRQRAPYDLIVANILARPLVAMAPQLARHLAPGGDAVLSGLLSWQEPMVLAAHRQQGLALVRRWRIGDWSALWLTKPRLS